VPQAEGGVAVVFEVVGVGDDLRDERPGRVRRRELVVAMLQRITLTL
jgi:hypothetical protein